MKIIKKYTAVQLIADKVNSEIKASLTFGNIEGPYYDEEIPKEEFDSEDEAIKYAYSKNKYATWLILPIVSFDAF